MYSKLCSKLWITLDNLKQDTRGVSAIEYAILAAIIIGVVVAAVTQLDLNGIFNSVSEKAQNAVNSN